jgi:hypothetical protein
VLFCLRSGTFLASSRPVFQRDFVYLLRNLRRSIARAVEKGARWDEDMPFTAEALIAALRRNFGGVSEEAFSRLATRFLSGCGFTESASKHGSLTLNTIATLRESLADTVDDGSDPNTAAFRHVLLLDPTDVEVAVGMVSVMRVPVLVLHRVYDYFGLPFSPL